MHMTCLIKCRNEKNLTEFQNWKVKLGIYIVFDASYKWSLLSMIFFISRFHLTDLTAENTDSLWIVGHFYLMNEFSLVEIMVQAFGYVIQQSF